MNPLNTIVPVIRDIEIVIVVDDLLRSIEVPIAGAGL